MNSCGYMAARHWDMKVLGAEAARCLAPAGVASVDVCVALGQ